MTHQSSKNTGQDSNGIFVITRDQQILEQDTVQGNSWNLQKAADFETAIKVAGFGKFNVLLILLAIPSSFASVFDTTTMSYILPISQCDLELSLQNKGMLNAITYVGMISSAFIWGCLADTMGRKKLLAVGYLLDGFFVVLCGFSQHYITLLAAKFMTGFIINGPFAALMSYVNEFHCAKHRAFIPFIKGMIQSTGSIILPLLGWLIFSDKLNISFLNGFVVLRSWNVFLLVCSLPSLIAGLGYTLLPESPKFLMSVGQNERALKVFQKVYSYNSGNPPDTYPIKVLVDETKLHKGNEYVPSGQETVNNKKVQVLKEGWQHIVRLFCPPYLNKIILVFSVQFGIMMGMHTLRLWLPQLFAAISNYLTFHQDEKDSDLCRMIEMINRNSSVSDESCFVNYSSHSVYTNNIIVASVSFILYVTAAALIGKLGKKCMLISSAVISGICGICLYFAQTEVTAVSLMSFYTGLTGVCTNVIISIAVDIFPTTLRTITVSLTMMFGRCGAILGNLVFPTLLAAGCLPPFLMVGFLVLGSALLATILPKTDTKALE